MKWYVYEDDESNYKMILDHNAIAHIKWNDSGKNVLYEASNLKQAADELVSTTKWKVTPRIITVEEINNITGKTGFDVNNSNDWYYFDTLNQTKADFTSSRSRYDWLYNNLKKCKTDSIDYGCSDEDNDTYDGYGTANGGQTLGYWTSSILGNAGLETNIWFVYGRGYLTNSGATSSGAGMRPVITINKTIFDK